MTNNLQCMIEGLNIGKEYLIMLTYAQSPLDFSIQVVNQDFNHFNEKLNTQYRQHQDTQYRYGFIQKKSLHIM